MTAVRLIPGDCIEVIPQLVAEGVVVDAIVTDPPYDLISISRNGSPRNNDPDTPFGRTKLNGKGFMSMVWDGTGIGFQSETWAAASSVLRPGGYLLAFGGTRTHHRIWCAIEDAGFVIQDTIMWLYGSGFPKGRAQLKPAFEPICVAYKPGGKRELQIDECRVPHVTVDGGSLATNPHLRDHINGGNGGKVIAHEADRRIVVPHTKGRWPANLCHSGDDEVMAAFAAFGEKSSGSRKAGEHQPLGMYANAIGPRPEGMERAMPALAGDTGSAARFFYCAKADNDDRLGSRHPTVKPVALMQWLVALVTAPGGTVLDPFAGSGTTGVAALAAGRKAILIEREAEYIADIRERMAHYEGAGRHSLVAKNRNGRQVDDLPLFADSDLPADWQERDSAGSWRVAIDEMRERLKDAAE